MAEKFTISGNLLTAVGAPATARIMKVVVHANVDPRDALVDLTNNDVYFFPTTVAASHDGLLSLTLVDTDATDTNAEPGTLRYRIVVTYSGSDKHPVTWESGWFELTEDTDLAAVAASGLSPMVVRWRDDLTAEMDAKIAEAEAIRAATAVDRAFVEARVVDDLETSDGQMKALMETPSSEVAQTLSNTFVAFTASDGGPLPPGKIVQIRLSADLTEIDDIVVVEA